MIISSVESNDLDQIVELNNIEAEWVGLKQRTFFETYLRIPFFRAVKEDGKISAFLMGMSQATDYDSKNFLWFRRRVKEFYYVDRIIVEPEKRGNGFGKALYQDLIRQRNGLPIVAEVSINPPNTESIGFHEAFGFKEIGRFSSDGKKMCRMYKLD